MDDVTGLGKHLETVVDSVLNDSKKTVKDLTSDANEAIAHLRTSRDLPRLFEDRRDLGVRDLRPFRSRRRSWSLSESARRPSGARPA